jgi:hypothetical protein
MKRVFVILFLTGIFNGFVFAQKTWTVAASPNVVKQYKGDLATGSVLADISWASTSSNACWPATENQWFNGNHVFYVSSIPAHAELYVTVIPDDPKQNMSIYGFQLGPNTTTMPPNITTCVACESERKWDRPKVGKTQDHTRTIYFNSTTDNYRIVIGVVGAEGLKTGTFKVKFDLKAAVEDKTPQAEIKCKSITLTTASVNTVKGNLSEGVVFKDLSWASTSSMACWPGTQNSKFTGNHVLYSVEIPTNLDIKFTVIPDEVKANFSIWAYQVGTNNNSLPPNIASCMACEAEQKWDYNKVGKTQDHTRFIEMNSMQGPYKFVIGVAGADGLKTGGYTLKIETSPMK